MNLQAQPWMALVYFIEEHAANKSLSAAHFALLLHLCYLWLKNGSEGSFSPHRDVLMELSRVKSRTTLSKLIRDLERLHLIKVTHSTNLKDGFHYQLLFNEKKMSTYSLLYSNLNNNKLDIYSVVTKIDSAVQNLSSRKPKSSPAQTSFLDSYPTQEKTKRPKFSKPTLVQVQEHFSKLQLPAVEADKFFNYYESNGWHVGKSSMKNWHAAANNWKNNMDKFKPHLKANSPQLGLFTSNNKIYDEPL